jgi:hypothetical protein
MIWDSFYPNTILKHRAADFQGLEELRKWRDARLRRCGVADRWNLNGCEAGDQTGPLALKEAAVGAYLKCLWRQDEDPGLRHMRMFFAVVSLTSHLWLQIEKGELKLNLLRVYNHPYQLSVRERHKLTTLAVIVGVELCGNDSNTLPFSVKIHAYATRRLAIFDPDKDTLRW